MKTTLLAVVGLSPQVLTETLYALHQEGVRVDAIRVITTRPGRDAIQAMLLASPEGRFLRYLFEYNHDSTSIHFSPENIRTLQDDLGNPLDDILDEEDNASLLAVCLEEVFVLTREPDTALILSIAGGRKTMGACLLSAASLYARPQDRICHVLVSPEFENHPDFFYPPRNSVPLTLSDPRGVPYVKETRYAQVRLVEIPFVSVRGLLPPEWLGEPLDPETILQRLVHRRAAPLLICDLTAGTVAWRDRILPMMPARLALYAFFLMEKRNAGCNAQRCRGCTDCSLEFAEIRQRQGEISDLYRRITEGARDPFAMSDTGILGLTVENFNSYKGKIRRDLLDAFGAAVDRKLNIEGKGKKPDTRYGVSLDRSKIRVVL